MADCYSRARSLVRSSFFWFRRRSSVAKVRYGVFIVGVIVQITAIAGGHNEILAGRFIT
jgi:hypothetical protein